MNASSYVVIDGKNISRKWLDAHPEAYPDFKTTPFPAAGGRADHAEGPTKSGPALKQVEKQPRGSTSDVVIEARVRTPAEITESLRLAAIESCTALSNHCQRINDKPRMYKANQAIHKLWEAE